jgi:hypothetical protein
MKKVFEAEILKKGSEKGVEYLNDEIKQFRNAIILKGVATLFVPVLIFLLIIAGIS